MTESQADLSKLKSEDDDGLLFVFFSITRLCELSCVSNSCLSWQGMTRICKLCLSQSLGKLHMIFQFDQFAKIRLIHDKNPVILL